jgi:hypothetical protein
MANYRSDQFSIGLTIEGLPEGRQTDNVAWDSLEGGDNTVEGQTYLPGGMKPLISMGGIPKRSPLTLKRIWSDTLIGIYKAMDWGAGQLACKVTVTTLNTKREAVPGAAVFTYTGTLGTVTRPNYSSETPEKAWLQIQVDPDGEIG